MATEREQRELATGVLVGRIRGIQARHPEAHEALTNWGLWSLDRSDIYPRLKPPSLWDQFKRSAIEEWGEVPDADPQEVEEELPVKAEGPDKLPFNEVQAIALDTRIHAPEGLCVEIRHSIRAAYVSRETLEHQFPRHAGCGEDSFCERLEAALSFVERFL